MVQQGVKRKQDKDKKAKEEKAKKAKEAEDAQREQEDDTWEDDEDYGEEWEEEWEEDAWEDDDQWNDGDDQWFFPLVHRDKCWMECEPKVGIEHTMRPKYVFLSVAGVRVP